jgi:hypothetical protein
MGNFRNFIHIRKFSYQCQLCCMEVNIDDLQHTRKKILKLAEIKLFHEL